MGALHRHNPDSRKKRLPFPPASLTLRSLCPGNPSLQSPSSSGRSYFAAAPSVPCPVAPASRLLPRRSRGRSGTAGSQGSHARSRSRGGRQGALRLPAAGLRGRGAVRRRPSPGVCVHRRPPGCALPPPAPPSRGGPARRPAAVTAARTSRAARAARAAQRVPGLGLGRRRRAASLCPSEAAAGTALQRPGGRRPAVPSAAPVHVPSCPGARSPRPPGRGLRGRGDSVGERAAGAGASPAVHLRHLGRLLRASLSPPFADVLGRSVESTSVVKQKTRAGGGGSVSEPVRQESPLRQCGFLDTLLGCFAPR